jgi:hypothetical protein
MEKVTSSVDSDVAAYYGRRMTEQDIAERIAEAYARGRAHERLDIVDFITSPPGRIPEWVRGQITELADAVKRGGHVGWASRLYEVES